MDRESIQGNRKEAITRIIEIFKRWVGNDVTTWPETFGDLENINNIFSGVGTAQETASCINNILHRYILGISPCSGGFKNFSFNPYLGDLDFIKGKVPTPSGDIIVECTKKDEKLIGTINVPDGLSGMPEYLKSRSKLGIVSSYSVHVSLSIYIYSFESPKSINHCHNIFIPAVNSK